METKITSSSEGIQFVYLHYKDRKYIVNRKYQRKLVWTIEEKQAFIDSLCRKYSVPLFLFAKDNIMPDKDRYEVIDGMQRLNAICSFIENEFPLEINGKEYYFDLESLARTKELRDNGELVQKHPIMDRDLCTSLVSYPLPISILSADEKSIETVFRRINSYGRQLSEQEIRLAGAVGSFPDLVRDISSAIRGDVSSSDIMDLNDMSKISISNRNLGYGIDIKEIFWIKNHLIGPEMLRTSRDEELISHILCYIIFDGKREPNKRTIDSLYSYDKSTPEYAEVKSAIDRIGKDSLRKNFLDVHNIMKEIAFRAKKPLREFISGDQKLDGYFRSYQVIFLSIYLLYINNDRRKIDYVQLLKKLEGIGPHELSNMSSLKWRSNARQNKIDAITGIIGPCFTCDNKRDVVRENWNTELENLLSLSLSEGTQYDFKQSCYRFDNGKFDNELIKKIVKTLCAMANRPNSVGYVIIGIADNKESAESYKKYFGTDYTKAPIGNFLISGIEGEVTKYHKNKLDDYIKKLKSILDTAPVERGIINQILQNIKCPSYYNHTVIVLSLTSINEPILYDNKVFIRRNNDCEEVKDTKSLIRLSQTFQSSGN